MRHSNFFGFVPMKKVRTDSGGRGRRMVETLERRGGEYQHTAFAFILGKMALAKINYIYGTKLVPVKKQVIR